MFLFSHYISALPPFEPREGSFLSFQLFGIFSDFYKEKVVELSLESYISQSVFHFPFTSFSHLCLQSTLLKLILVQGSRVFTASKRIEECVLPVKDQAGGGCLWTEVLCIWLASCRTKMHMLNMYCPGHYAIRLVFYVCY